MKDDTIYKALYLKIAFEDDHDAFKELFFEFYPSLCVFAGRYIYSSDACEDIVQDVFYNIWKNRKSLNIHFSIRNFLVTSVRNSCIDYLRKESSHDKYLENIHDSYNNETPINIYTIKELQVMVEEALNKLPQSVQTAFKMSRSKNMTYKKIALEMNISIKTVESYISQALKMLRIELKDYLSLALFITYLIK